MPVCTSIRSNRFNVRMVFHSDGEKPIPRWVHVVISAQELKLSMLMTNGRRQLESTDTYRLTELKGISLAAAACRAASISGRAMLFTKNSVSVRMAWRKRPRLTIRPHWPLDFELHFYASEHFDVELAAAMLLGVTCPPSNK